MSRPEPPTWDEQYATGDFRTRWHREHPSRELCTVVAASLVPTGGRVLDVGCGAGTEAIYLARRGYRVTAVDFSTEAIRVAQERAAEAGVRVRWFVADALALPLLAGSVDFAFDRGCFHHVEQPDRPRYAAEIARVLRPGGRLFLRGYDASGGALDSHFVPVTVEAIDRAFDALRFARGPVEVLEPPDEADPRAFVGVFITRL